MDLSALRTPVALEIAKENWVPADSKMVNGIASIGDVFIRQRTEPLLTLK